MNCDDRIKILEDKVFAMKNMIKALKRLIDILYMKENLKNSGVKNERDIN